MRLTCSYITDLSNATLSRTYIVPSSLRKFISPSQSAYTSIISLGCLLIESSHLSMTLTSSRYHHHSTTSTNIHSCFFIISSLSTLTTAAHYCQAAKPADSRKLLSSKEKKHDTKMSCTSILPVWSRGCILIILH